MIIVVGENVVDLIPAGDGLLRPALGGGPANTAVAVARLGGQVAFAGRFGNDTYGRAFRARLHDAGVDLCYAVDAPNPSALALASLDASGAATYDFWLDNAADFTDAPLPTTSGDDIAHIGSLGAYWPPGADGIERWIDSAKATVTLDVNLRPIVLETQPDAIDRLGRLVQRAHVVKASDDDLLMAYPGIDPETTARAWLEAPGPALVVLTLGAKGAVGLSRDGRRVHVPAPLITVADTIGAGDAAMGALLTRLAAIGLTEASDDLEGTLRYIVATSALACTRTGAYAPSASDVEASMRVG